MEITPEEKGHRVAIIDLGTNTFNILIAEVIRGEWNVLFRNRIAVKLALGGMNEGRIAEDRFVRGIDALNIYAITARNFKCNEVLAFATSAIRDASNGLGFTKAAKLKTGIDIIIIQGDREAELIYKGVVSKLNGIMGKCLIMDIGGGSTEFILGEGDHIIWKYSFPLGVSRIKEVLDPSDPLSSRDLNELKELLDETLVPLWQIMEKHKVDLMIGSSGSFDTFRNILLLDGSSVTDSEDQVISEMNITSFNEVANNIIRMNYPQRLKVPGMMPMRADTLHLSAILIQHVLEKCQIRRLMRSAFALKEGALLEWMEKFTLERNLKES